MKIRHFIPILACTMFAVAAHGAAEVDAVVARARAYLGSEKALDAVKSLRFSGTIVEGNEKRGTIVITLKKPYQQRIERTIGNEREITALDGFDAWSRIESLDNPDGLRLTLIPVEDIKRLQANNAENLNFFKGAQIRGGSVEMRGEATIDGVDCVKVAFVHGPGIEFVRYFDKATGRLVMTETERGGQIRERGEQVVAGIRFPKSLESSFNDRAVVISFDKVEVNGDYPDSLFAFPSVLTP